MTPFRFAIYWGDTQSSGNIRSDEHASDLYAEQFFGISERDLFLVFPWQIDGPKPVGSCLHVYKRVAVTQPLDVIVLDIMLPGMDGLELCRKLREDAGLCTPVLMLTAKDTLADKLAGFDVGADDYVLKPFALKELEARLKALVWRAKRDLSRVLDCGKLRIDTGRRLVTRAGAAIELNRSCYRILVELMSKAPDVVTREDLEHLLWGDMRPASDALRSHVYALRKAIDTSGEPSIVETVHGVGFRIGAGR